METQLFPRPRRALLGFIVEVTYLILVPCHDICSFISTDFIGLSFIGGTNNITTQLTQLFTRNSLQYIFFRMTVKGFVWSKQEEQPFWPEEHRLNCLRPCDSTVLRTIVKNLTVLFMEFVKYFSILKPKQYKSLVRIDKNTQYLTSFGHWCHAKSFKFLYLKIFKNLFSWSVRSLFPNVEQWTKIRIIVSSNFKTCNILQ